MYATRADLLAVLRVDSQAKLTTDPTRRWVVGTGDGTTRGVATPFVETTMVVGYVNDSTVVASVSRSAERDWVAFATAPALGTVVAVTVDAGAVNADVIDGALTHASNVISGSFLDGAPAGSEAVLKAHAVNLSLVFLRQLRNLEVTDAMLVQLKMDDDLRKDLRRKSIPVAATSSTGVVMGSSCPVFGRNWL